MAKKKIKVPKVVDGVPQGEVEIEVDDSAGPSWGANDQHRLINKPMVRVDGAAKACGTAVYTQDVRPPGMLFGKFLTSSRAHAKISKLDLAPAQKIEGVKSVLPVVNVGGEVRFEGQPVVAVAATSPELAEDAARAVLVEYEDLPHVVKADEAMKPNAPQVGGPARRVQKQGNPEQTLAALAKCDAVVEVEYRTPTLHHSCLETHSIIADFRGGDSATIYASTQGTFTIPADSARELGLQQSKVTSIVQHMGGGFGSKFGIGIAGQWACRLAKALGAPVKMALTRREEFLAAGNGPGSVQRFRAGANKDGTLVAVHAIQFALPGIGNSNIAAQPYQYKAQNTYRESQSLNTHEDSAVALRAPGHPQASFAMESLVDELAYKLGIDPIEFRKKNIPDKAWHRQLDRGAKEIGWERRNQTPGGGKGPLKRGMGCGIGAWGGGGNAQCVVDVTIGQDGSVTAAVGTQDLGTGTRTYIHAIVAEELGLEMGDVVEKIGNSQLGNANASGGSTTAASLAPAVKDAAFNARIEMAKRVAPILGAQPDAILFDKRQVMGNGKALNWKQACAALPAGGLTARGKWQPTLAASGVHGTSFAEVEVDVETGHVHVVKMCHVQDCGLPLNRTALHSQINGGMIQSIGMALYEGRVMDSDLGVMVNPGFGDYKLPGTLEMPELIPVIDDGDTRQAVIGMAEGANVPGVGAIANAVYNACGVRVRELPITPDKILNGLMQLRRG
ncbi:MAG TPA: xanthine dehydrogenase family protein molybdopterin-binding subunit [Tepidisphaeraceae bacterium]|jgi:xanthine dehydrogenase YagR molybdenum-binding subunit|nr:xanthine dehydrogenase family protein molybdopterin-binding subunit [Tepidisphaeraceae bacterium]